MSLLTACQAAIKETGIGDVPATIISNTERTAVQLNALAERAAKSIMRQDWQATIREHTITTANGTEGYNLPSDWARYISQTAWDATNFWPMRGAIAPATWQALKRGLVVIASVRREFRLRGGQVLIIPTPTTVDTLIIEYVRNTPWINGGVTYKVTATADADTTVFPEYLLEMELIWRWLKAKGLSYAEEKMAAELEASRVFAQDSPAPIIDFSMPTGNMPNFTANIPQIV